LQSIQKTSSNKIKKVTNLSTTTATKYKEKVKRNPYSFPTSIKKKKKENIFADRRIIVSVFPKSSLKFITVTHPVV